MLCLVRSVWNVNTPRKLWKLMRRHFLRGQLYFFDVMALTALPFKARLNTRFLTGGGDSEGDASLQLEPNPTNSPNDPLVSEALSSMSSETYRRWSV